MKKQILLASSIAMMLSTSLLTSSTASGVDPIFDGMQVRVFDNNGAQFSSGPANQPLTLEVLLGEPNVVAPNPTEPITINFHPFNGSPDVITNVNVPGSFIGCGTPTPNCFYIKWQFSEASSGTFTVSYSGTNTVPNPTFSRPLDFWVPQARAFSDKKDEKTGFQVHAVYVVPSNGIDRKRDTSGQISTWMMQGSRWLDREAGDHWQVDTSAKVADVTYFKSKYPTVVLTDVQNNPAALLMKEISSKILPPGTNRKVYVLFIESPNFINGPGDAGYVGGQLCGLSAIEPIRSVIVSTGTPDTVKCSGYADTMDWQAAVATHETVHSFGVEHVKTPYDLMLQFPQDNWQKILLDPARTQYYGGSLAGTDISKLRIWSKAPTSAKASWPCIYQETTSIYYCSVGITKAVNAFMAQCWQKVDPTMFLQTKVKNVWKNIAKPSKASSPNCPKDFTISYAISFSSKKVGSQIYRFKSRQWTGRTFTVLYQN